MAVEGIDGCWIGPGDLGRYMRLDLNTAEGREVHESTIRSIIAASRRAGKIPGISTASAEDAQRWIDEGCLFVTAGVDTVWVADKARETLQALGRCVSGNWTISIPAVRPARNRKNWRAPAVT